MIKRYTTNLADYFVRTSLGTFFVRILYKVYEYFRYRRSLYEHQLAEKKLEEFFPELTVRSGFMTGLKYPSCTSFGSSIFPKFAGTYENEIEPVFKKLQAIGYETIIDVGSAEGYYAVGLARQFPAAKVFAFDIDSTARELCSNMALINGVKDRVTILSECTPQWLAEFKSTDRTLLVCDCEGYERHLFNDTNIAALKHSDLIIELHPMYEKNVKEYLISLFFASHDIQFISSNDDRRKIFDLEDSYLSLTELEKIKLVQEGRAFTMDWLIAFSRVK